MRPMNAQVGVKWRNLNSNLDSRVLVFNHWQYSASHLRKATLEPVFSFQKLRYWLQNVLDTLLGSSRKNWVAGEPWTILPCWSFLQTSADVFSSHCLTLKCIWGLQKPTRVQLNMTHVWGKCKHHILPEGWMHPVQEFNSEKSPRWNQKTDVTGILPLYIFHQVSGIAITFMSFDQKYENWRNGNNSSEIVACVYVYLPAGGYPQLWEY